MNLALIIIVFCELLGGSLWFSANGAADGLEIDWGITTIELGYLTSAVQLGFIFGTLLFALSGLADRFSASRLFAVSALLGALANAGFALADGDLGFALLFRFLTGVMLAGVYPVGMKLVVGWAPEKKGLVLGWLVGMLTLGTALPHFVRSIGNNADWQTVIFSASALALIAAVCIFFLGDGPHTRSSSRTHWGGVFSAFKHADFRSAVFGYFGHMWELYAFWTITPLMIAIILKNAGIESSMMVSLLSFLVIGLGALGCIAGGYLSKHFGSAKVAVFALACSGGMCLLFPLILFLDYYILIVLMCFWGVMVVADSPQFSALAAGTCPSEFIGSALAIMNSVGFFITIFSIELTTSQFTHMGNQVVWLLLPGPLLGLWSMRRLVRSKPASA